MPQIRKTADPCVLVIFGATGDLTKRKLLPAICNLNEGNFLPENFAIIGVGRQELTTAQFQKQIVENIKEFAGGAIDGTSLKWLKGRLYYTGGDFDDDKKLFGDLKKLLGKICKSHNIPENFLYYMATPPELFATVTKKIVDNGLGREERKPGDVLFLKSPSGKL